MDQIIDAKEGFVRLDACMADDLSVVNSARVSFAKKVDRVGEAGVGLIDFLMREKHGTPFEHNAFRFHVKCPVFVAREWFRHRIGSFNEFSARYSEVENDFFVPPIESIRKQIGKPGSYSFERIDGEISKEVVEAINENNRRSYGMYSYLLQIGVAKEVARMVLPVSMFTQFYWTVNARSLMNFLALRNSSHAQKEIQWFASRVEAVFAEKMPLTHQSWVNNGRICP